MKARIRPHNLTVEQRSELDRAAREYFASKVEEYAKGLQWRLTRRTIFAVCLSLSDLFNFGSKRCQRVVEGFSEILSGVADDVYDKKDIDPDGVDRMADNMAAELLDRGIVIEISGDPHYDDVSKIKERKSALGAQGLPETNGESFGGPQMATRESAKVITQ